MHASADTAQTLGAHGRHEAAWIENRPPSRWLPALDIAEMWARRELVLVLALKDLRVRYKQTLFGVAWAVLQPLLAALIFTVFLGRLAHVSGGGLPYPVFVYAGMSMWFYVSGAVSSSAQSLVDNRDLVTKVYFPRLLAPIAGVVPGLVDLVPALAILAVFLGVYDVVPGPALALLPLWILVGAVLALAIGLWLAALNVRYRDVRYALPFLLQIWLFGSPVVYASSLVHGAWRYAYAANPMTSLLEGFRWSVAGGAAPGVESLVSLAVVLALLAGGFVYFWRTEQSFADVI
jgi:lipopolysaccharide transport system permease protein